MSARKKWFIIGIAAILTAAAAVFLLFYFFGRKSDLPYDISLSSQAGFTADDLRMIRETEGVVSLVGVCEQVSDSCIIQSYPETLLTPELTEGRQIQASNEVIVDSRYAAQKNLQLGQTMTLTVGDSPASYSVVGIASPVFDLKNGAKPFFFVDLTAFHSDVYHKIYLRIADDANLSRVQRELHTLASERQTNRCTQLRNEFQLKIDEIEHLMHTLLDPEKEALDQAKSQLYEAEVSLDIPNNTQKLADARVQLDSSKSELDLGLQKLDDLKAVLDDSQATLSRYEAELSQSTVSYHFALAKAGISEFELDAKYEQLSALLSSSDGADAAIIERSLKDITDLLEMRSGVNESKRKCVWATSDVVAKTAAYQLGEQLYQSLLTEYEAKEAEYEAKSNAFAAAKSEFYAKQAEYLAAKQDYQEREDEYVRQLADYTQQRDSIQSASWIIFRFSQDGTIPSEAVAFS